MTEKQAWMKLAKEFRKDLWDRNILADGVCDAVAVMGRLPTHVFNSMKLKLEKERQRRHRGQFQYWWAFKDGADENRARFCERMARRCK